MRQYNLEELKKQNHYSARAMGFLSAAILGMLAYGFILSSLPAFLLAGVFTFLLFAESKAYKKNCKNESEAMRLKNLMQQLTNSDKDKLV